MNNNLLLKSIQPEVKIKFKFRTEKGIQNLCQEVVDCLDSLIMNVLLFPTEDKIFKNATLKQFPFNKWDLENNNEFEDSGISVKITADKPKSFIAFY